MKNIPSPPRQASNQDDLNYYFDLGLYGMVILGIIVMIPIWLPFVVIGHVVKWVYDLQKKGE